MTRRQAIFAMALIALVAPATAQQRPSPAQEVEILQHDLENRVFAMRQRVEQLSAEWAARGQRTQDLENYARACGDKPGCFLAAPPQEQTDPK